MKRTIFDLTLIVGLVVAVFMAFSWIFLLGVILLVIWIISEKRNYQKPLNVMKAAGVHIKDGFTAWVEVFKDLPRPAQYVAGCGAIILGVMGLWHMLKPGNAPIDIPPTNAATTTANIPYPDLVPAPLGVNRYDMTTDQLAWRIDLIIQTRTFWIMREGDAIKGAERIDTLNYQSFVKAAAALYKVSADDIEAIHYLESFGDTKAKSPTGPIGPGQFTRRTGSNIGPVKDGKCLVRFEGIPCGGKLPKVLPKVVEDNRTDVELSVYATAKLLADETKFFGDGEFALMAYHSSRDDVRNWVKKYLEPQPVDLGGKIDIQRYGITYGKLYFGSTPYKNPGTYAMYRQIMQEDWGANYPWKVRCAQRLLKLYRTNRFAFETLARDNKFRGNRAKYRMWTFYRENDMKFATLDDLKSKIKSGELVVIPQDPEKYGFKLRIEGSGMIAELDKANVKNYIATRKETAGALLWISQELKKLRASNGFLLDVTSVSRTEEYQKKLTKKNTTATKELSFHVLARAFDIAKNALTADQQRDLLFILDELDSTGMISWIPENNAYHIVVAPDDKAQEFFTRIYNDSTEFRQSSKLVVSDANWF